MKVNREYTTSSISRWLNTGEYIMLHHTWPWDEINIVKYLAYSGVVSCHFVVWKDGVIYQLADLGAITWHAGDSKRDGKSQMNKYAVGIEIVSNWHDFTDKQRESVRELCNYLIGRLWLDSQKIIRHLDVAWFRWKWDVGDSFWFDKYDSWEAYQLSYRKREYAEKEIEELRILKRF
jgi:N-acetyl-anhydromuramyl-L-alanine amidase AmpD